MGDVALTVAFIVFSAATLVGAIGVVTIRNLFRAAMFLALSFLAIAGLYITLHADFLGVVQILIYAGAVAVLIVFAIMLTHRPERGNPPSRFRASALIIAGLLAILMIWAAVQTTWPMSGQPPLDATVPALAQALFGPYVLPFEVASVVLLAAMVGAIVLARED